MQEKVEEAYKALENEGVEMRSWTEWTEKIYNLDLTTQRRHGLRTSEISDLLLAKYKTLTRQ